MTLEKPDQLHKPELSADHEKTGKGDADVQARKPDGLNLVGLSGKANNPNLSLDLAEPDDHPHQKPAERQKTDFTARSIGLATGLLNETLNFAEANTQFLGLGNDVNARTQAALTGRSLDAGMSIGQNFVTNTARLGSSLKTVFHNGITKTATDYWQQRKDKYAAASETEKGRMDGALAFNFIAFSGGAGFAGKAASIESRASNLERLAGETELLTKRARGLENISQLGASQFASRLAGAEQAGILTNDVNQLAGATRFLKQDSQKLETVIGGTGVNKYAAPPYRSAQTIQVGEQASIVARTSEAAPHSASGATAEQVSSPLLSRRFKMGNAPEMTLPAEQKALQMGAPIEPIHTAPAAKPIDATMAVQSSADKAVSGAASISPVSKLESVAPQVEPVALKADQVAAHDRVLGTKAEIHARQAEPVAPSGKAGAPTPEPVGGKSGPDVAKMGMSSPQTDLFSTPVAGAKPKPGVHQVEPGTPGVEARSLKVEPVGSKNELLAHQAESGAPKGQPQSLKVELGASKNDLVARQAEPVAPKGQAQSLKIEPAGSKDELLAHQAEPGALKGQPRSLKVEPTGSRDELLAHQVEPGTPKGQPRSLKVEPVGSRDELLAHQVEPGTPKGQQRSLKIEPAEPKGGPRSTGVEPRVEPAAPKTEPSIGARESLPVDVKAVASRQQKVASQVERSQIAAQDLANAKVTASTEQVAQKQAAVKAASRVATNADAVEATTANASSTSSSASLTVKTAMQVAVQRTTEQLQAAGDILRAQVDQGRAIIASLPTELSAQIQNKAQQIRDSLDFVQASGNLVSTRLQVLDQVYQYIENYNQLIIKGFNAKPEIEALAIAPSSFRQFEFKALDSMRAQNLARTEALAPKYFSKLFGPQGLGTAAGATESSLLNRADGLNDLASPQSLLRRLNNLSDLQNRLYAKLTSSAAAWRVASLLSFSALLTENGYAAASQAIDVVNSQGSNKTHTLNQTPAGDTLLPLAPASWTGTEKSAAVPVENTESRSSQPSSNKLMSASPDPANQAIAASNPTNFVLSPVVAQLVLFKTPVQAVPVSIVNLDSYENKVHALSFDWRTENPVYLFSPPPPPAIQSAVPLIAPRKALGGAIAPDSSRNTAPAFVPINLIPRNLHNPTSKSSLEGKMISMTSFTSRAVGGSYGLQDPQKLFQQLPFVNPALRAGEGGMKRSSGNAFTSGVEESEPQLDRLGGSTSPAPGTSTTTAPSLLAQAAAAIQSAAQAGPGKKEDRA